MAINVQKFLPQARTTSEIVKGSISSSLQNKKIDSNKIIALSKQYNTENINLIKKSLLDIDSLLKSFLTNEQQLERNERLQKERKQRDEIETTLEAPREKKKFNLPTISIPGTSFLDRIKKFLFFTALGFLFDTFQSQIPKLKRIFVAIGKVYNVAETIFKFILESIVGFVDKSYQLYDKVRETVKIIGGERAQKIFDELSSNLNKYINYVLIGGLALTGAIESFASNVRSYKPPTSRPSPGSGGRPRVTTSGGRPSQRLDVRSPFRQRPTITTSGGEILSGAAKKQVGKNFLRLIKAPLSRAPLIGGLIEFGISWALGDPVSKAAFRGVGNLLVGAVGTAIGGPIGAVVGGIIGGELGARLYDILFENKKPPQPVQKQQSGGRVLNIKGYASGGQIIGGEGRTLKIQKKTIANILPQTSQPGKDVGGEKEIQRLYPDSVDPKEGNPWITAILGRVRSTITNPFRTLERIANTFKQIPFGIGALMGGAIDAALGQKMSEGTLNSISTGLESLFENINSKNYNFYESMFSKKSEIPTMAVGGIVERTGGIVQESDFNPKKLITPYIESTVGQVIEIVRRELSLGKEKPKEEKKPEDDTSTSIRGAEPSTASTGALTGTDVGGIVVGYVGSTGRSSGPHIHIETGDGYSGAGGNIPDYILNNIIVDGKPLSSHPKGDGLGAGRGHRGFDYPIRSGAPITLKGGLKFVEYDDGYNAGYGNSLIISDSSGRKYLISHLSGGPSNPEKIKELAEKQKAQQQPPLDQTQSAKITPDKSDQGASIGKGSANSALLDFISSGEGGYNSMNQGTRNGRIVGSTHNASTILGKNLYDMTVGEIMDLQASEKLFAAGRYQIIPSTMKLAVSRSGVSRNEKFNSAVQDKLGLTLIYNGQRPRLSSYLQGKTDDLRGAMVDLAEEWASVPHPDTGRSVYPPANVSSHSVEEVKKVLTSARAKKAAKGGLLTPLSAYHIQKQSPKDKISPLNKYPSYSPEGGTRVIVQPMIQEKIAPVPIPVGGNKLTSFRVSGGVNNNTNKGLMRG